jgi:hypothetical protein
MEDSRLVLAPARSPLLQGPGPLSRSLASHTRYGSQGILILRGREAVLSRLGMLNELCERTGQAGATRWLDHQMRTPTERKKIPTLVLVGRGASVGAESATDLRGAVILYEYKFAGWGVNIFAADDSSGQRVVIAPKHLREEVVEEVCDALVKQGALAVMMTYDGQMERDSKGVRGNSARCERATRARNIPLYLPLGATFEATLASLGKHTRRNLRYYRRRAEGTLGTEFVPRAALSRSEFLEINRSSIDPVSDELARWRYDEFAHASEVLFAGVRSRDGRWLSLIGGRRYGQVTEIDWQMNLAGLPRLSLSTVMRCYLLEHEIGLGTGKLFFNGGTPHSMRHSFVRVDVVDAIALRESPVGRMLRTLAQLLKPKRNFLAQALYDPQIRWARS